MSMLNVRCLIFLVLAPLSSADLLVAGVARAIQNSYRQKYENKALFLRYPLFAEVQLLSIRGGSFRWQQAYTPNSPRFKVGDRVRILKLDFGGDQIKVKLSSISGTLPSEIIYKFDQSLREDFPNKGTFEAALEATFTEDSYSDLEQSKRSYAGGQFERLVGEIVRATGSKREEVLQSMARQNPAHQDALRDVENVQKRLSELSERLSKAQRDNEVLTKERNQQRLQGSDLQQKVSQNEAEISQLRKNLQVSEGKRGTYQSELTSLQRSLNLKVDVNRGLESQVGGLNAALGKLKSDKQALETQAVSLKEKLAGQEKVNSRLSGEIENLKTSSRKMQSTIRTLTSGKDSIAGKYVELTKIRERLEGFRDSVQKISVRTVQERSEEAVSHARISLFLSETHLGDFEIQIPEYLGTGESKPATAHFHRESVDTVKLSKEDRELYQSLGEKVRLEATLKASAEFMEATSETDELTRQVAEREDAGWQWSILNHANEDVRFQFRASLLNSNEDSIPVLEYEKIVLASNIVSRARSYLQPIPIVIGTLLGSLLFGIFGIFRRGRSTGPGISRPGAGRVSPGVGKKQL